MQFDWDNGNRAKCRKHGVPLEETEAFFRSQPNVHRDPVHSGAEERFIAVGMSPSGRLIFAAFCWRHGKVRPVSVRYMREREVRKYEKSTDPED